MRSARTPAWWMRTRRPLGVAALVVAGLAAIPTRALFAQAPRAQDLDSLVREVVAVRALAERRRVADTADGDARARHPVHITRWLVRWRRTPSGDLRQALAAAVLADADTTQLDSATARAIGETLDPSSRVWSLPVAHFADAVGAVLRLAAFRDLGPERSSVNDAYRGRWLAALDSALARPDATPDARRQSLVRAARLRGRRESLAAARPYIDRLITEFPREHDAEVTIAAYGEAGTVRVGARSPDFRVRSLDGRSVITAASFAGRVVLIDVWATWCGPCITEMPVIERVWRRHRAEGFEVLSVSMDRQPGHVTRFRAVRHPMPWRHGFATLLDDLPVVFGVKQVPRAILLGRDGTIVAMDHDLRGDALEATVRAALATPR